MIIDCISDLHGHYPKLEGGDLLIVAGDLTAHDTHSQYLQFLSWLHRQSYKHYIFIAGNHDNLIQRDEVILNGLANTSHLCDSGTEFHYFDDRFPEEDEGFLPSGRRTLKIWGSPWTKRFEGMNPKCMAFTVDTEEELEEKWIRIPKDVDILITHSPSHGMLDEIEGGIMCGCPLLTERIYQIKPKLHICGHIHEAYGKHYSPIDTPFYPTIFVNASHVNECYEPVNKPIRIEL